MKFTQSVDGEARMSIKVEYRLTVRNIADVLVANNLEAVHRDPYIFAKIVEKMSERHIMLELRSYAETNPLDLAWPHLEEAGVDDAVEMVYQVIKKTLGQE